MKLTTKGRFAVAAMLDLASQADDTPVSLMSISDRQNISLSYLEQLFAKLRRHQLVKSFRGPGGGYLLAQSKEAISIADIIDAVDEAVDVTNCQGRGDCKERWPCIAHHLWSGLNQIMMDYLNKITLADLVSQQPCDSEPRERVEQLLQQATVSEGGFLLAGKGRHL